MIFFKKVTDMIDMNISHILRDIENNINMKLCTLMNDNIDSIIFNGINLFVNGRLILYQLDNDNEIN